MRVRPASDHDADAVRKILWTVLDEFGLRDDHQGADRDLDALTANYADRGGLFDVVEDDDGIVVGMVAVDPKDDRVCVLRKLYLLPRVRGLGWGRFLLDHALAFARAKGFHLMELETSSRLVRAIELYREYGFQPKGCEQHSVRCDQSLVLDLEQAPRHCRGFSSRPTSGPA